MSTEYSYFRKILCVLLAALFSSSGSGCAIHPLPEDVTRETTTAIVHKIRCEARDALNQITANIIRDHGSPSARWLADGLIDGTIDPTELTLLTNRRAMNLSPVGIKLFQTYVLTAVTFDFQFTIQETNDRVLDSNFRLPLTEGIFTLNLKGGSKFDRMAKRKFQITNSFYELHREVDREFCEGVKARAGNIVYSIVGRIGLDEVFSTFIQIDGGIHTITDQTDRFTDTLTFTTTLTAGAIPKISLNPLSSRRFQLSDATATLGETRSDEHQVAISIIRGPLVLDFDPLKIQAQIAKAKLDSQIIANQNRFENLLDVQRNAILSRN